jgi:hypothetical protein
MVASRPLAIDFSVSHAGEELSDAKFSAKLEGHGISNESIALGNIGHTRVSLPLSYSFFGPIDPTEKGTQLRGSFGLLCESRILSSGFGCGYSASAKLSRRTLGKDHTHIAIDFESAADIDRFKINLGHEFAIDREAGLSLSVNIGSIQSSEQFNDYSGQVSLLLTR